MGNGAAANHRARSKQIEKELQKTAAEEAKVMKLLLLGSAECGKSTILKQMRIIHAAGFSEEEYEMHRPLVFNNVFEGISTIATEMPNLGLKFEDPQCENLAKFLEATIKSNAPKNELTPELVPVIKRLWQDAGTQAAFLRSNEYQLSDSIKYFLDDIDRLGSPGYRPSCQDLLRVRVPTTGIVELVFQMKEVMFRVFDVGGQRSQRRKWINCFDHVKAIIFIVALSEYDQLLMEDGKTNRMKESLELFRTIVNYRCFLKINFILFLNKKDLFESKILRSPITVAFPEYLGPQAYRDSLAYIETAFRTKNENAERHLYCHHTCSTDTDQVQLVLENCLDTLVSQNMSNLGVY